MAHVIGVVGGDGIGPEVVAEGLKALARGRCGARHRALRLGGRPLPARRHRVDRRDRGGVAGARCPVCGGGGHSRGAPRRDRAGGCCCECASNSTLYVNRRPFRAPRRGLRVRGHPGEHRGNLRRRGRVPAPPHARRGGHPGVGEHPFRGWSAACATPSSWPAAARGRHLTLVHKTNVLTFSGDLWERTFNKVAEEYPDVATAYNHVDAACIYFVEDPKSYDVIVTDNPVRRHSHRPGRSRRRRHRAGRVGQPEPGPHRAVHV